MKLSVSVKSWMGPHDLKFYAHLKFIFALSVPDPILALGLRINQQWIPGSFGDNDAVLDRELIIW